MPCAGWLVEGGHGWTAGKARFPQRPTLHVICSLPPLHQHKTGRQPLLSPQNSPSLTHIYCFINIKQNTNTSFGALCRRIPLKSLISESLKMNIIFFYASTVPCSRRIVSVWLQNFPCFHVFSELIFFVIQKVQRNNMKSTFGFSFYFFFILFLFF